MTTLKTAVQQTIQNKAKKCTKKSVLHVQILLIRPTGLLAVLVAVAV